MTAPGKQWAEFIGGPLDGHRLEFNATQDVYLAPVQEEITYLAEEQVSVVGQTPPIVRYRRVHARRVSPWSNNLLSVFEVDV